MGEERTEIAAFNELCEEIRRLGRVSDEHINRLTALFGARFIKAWRAVRDDRVKKYIFRPSGRVVWIVVGREGDYLVIPEAEFCSCDDFYFHVMSGRAYLCYHLIGQKIAEALGRYDEIEENDEMYDVLMGEWKKQP